LRCSAEVQLVSQDDEGVQFLNLEIHERTLSQIRNKFIGRKTVDRESI
jgi:hypothetical protein